MKTLYIVTGADGHLARHIILLLSQRENCLVRGLLLPSQQGAPRSNTEYFIGDVTKPETLDALFAPVEGYETIVIHAAGIISIAEKIPPFMYNINVNGTKNIIAKCREYGVKRLEYVSSVHAIPELPNRVTMSEVKNFSPKNVNGAYAKTKAEATEAVLQATASGLDAVVVHPSGIIGPLDNGGNHLNELIELFITGKLPACVEGGYDFVDVRDVAMGCIAAADRGVRGETYILSNKYYTIEELLRFVASETNEKAKRCIPIWLAKIAAPFIEAAAKLSGTRPLYTSYSLYTLNANSNFSHQKAAEQLGYKPRDIKATIKDTVKWFIESTNAKKAAQRA